MLQRILHKKVFMFSFILFLLCWYFLSAGGVFSFNLFSAWTYKQGNIKIGENYVKASEVDDTIVGLVIANMTFGEGEYTVQGEKAMQDAVSLFATSNALVQVDILELVTKSPNAKEVLDAHLQHTNTTLEKITLTSSSLKEVARGYVERSNSCLQEKRGGDQLFFQGVQGSDKASTIVGLETSLEFAPCYITNRIKANAYAYMAQKVATHATILRRRQQLLENNAESIINHTAYLEGDVLEQLFALRNEIQQVNSVNYQQVESLLNLNIFSGDRDFTSLPNYDKVFFNNHENMPRFDGNTGGIESLSFGQ